LRFSQKPAIVVFTNGWIMRVRDVERLLVKRGAGAAKMDAVTRRLRACGRLPTGGRGPNAPRIGPQGVAAILLALAGSTTGAEADVRLEKLVDLPGVGGGSRATTLLQALTDCLEEPAALDHLIEVRVARTRKSAKFVYRDEPEVMFGAAPQANKFYVEGVLPGELLREIAKEIMLRDGNEDLGIRS
jgi:hypothetical protein